MRLGVEHILLGVDHLLFVLGLLLIVGDRWMLVKTITSFTVAHSITLAIATLGYASAPLLPLNAAIALSILFLGPEIVRKWRGETSFTIRHPWIVAFAFGLLHGFGFASGLTTMGLPQAEIPLALLLFNVGVEVGQLFFVGLILGLERAFRTLEIRWPRFVEALPGYAVGSLGAYWTIQRTLVLLGGAAMTRPVRVRLRWRRRCCSRAPSPLLAHEQAGQAQGFLTGFLHPLSGLDHVLAMIAVGLWGAQLGPPALWLLPVTFPMVMALGGFLGLMGVPLPGVEIGIALSALLLGSMVAREAKPPLVVGGAAGRLLRDLSRPRPRHRAAGRPERAGVQHRLRRRDRAAPRRRHRDRRGPPMAGGTHRAARGRRRRGPGRRRVPVEGGGVTRSRGGPADRGRDARVALCRARRARIW